jgi:hypothetical protein
MMDDALEAANADIISRENADERPSVGRLLTASEWAVAMPPLVSIKVDFPEWGTVEYEIGLKYALRNAIGWVYFSNKRYIFERTEDYMRFKLWIGKNPMINGDIEVE